MNSILPDSAPFNDEQKAWLNGFFAGLLGMQPGANANAAGMLAAATEAPPEPEDTPWHDPALQMEERMSLAEGKPLELRLMAAMAQLDCGSCGSDCATYSRTIAIGEESNLTLCSPGGKETKQMLKKILADEAPAGSNGAPVPKKLNGANGYSRQNPLPAKLIESRLLNLPGSAKATHHVAIDLGDSAMTYEVGDALGVFPCNCSSLVAEIVELLQADAAANVSTPLGNEKSLAKALEDDCCLRDPSDELLELLAAKAGDDVKAQLKQMLDDGCPEGFDVLDALKLGVATDAAPTAAEFVSCLEPLNPRLYSIASSMKRVGSQVHLTVGKVEYEREGRVRKGVASTMLCDRVQSGQSVQVFVQPNHHGFTVPAEADAPMIMVGPGTGIAPFLAFLQERAETKASGDNWLFFGSQHQATDFLYEAELQQFLASGVLNRLDTAFSRDSDQKEYVQDRLLANGGEVWQWLERGGSFFVCGAARMGTDVDVALKRLIATHGGMSAEAAEAYVKELAASGRYVRDVY